MNKVFILVFLALFLVNNVYSGPGRGLFKGVKTYQVYVKRQPVTGTRYSGHTSGYGTPKQNVAKRDYSHHKNKEGYEKARVVKSFDNLSDARKYEQKLIDNFGGSRRSGGTSGNEINATRRPANEVKID